MYSRIIFITTMVMAPVAGHANEAIELTFVDHLEADMIEQDVYVDKNQDGKLFRVTKDEADQYMDAKVYRTATPVEHAPMDASKIGPYDPGEELEFTLADWLSASGTGQYVCEGGTGTVSVEFQNLVPNGLYTMWNFFAGQNLERFRTYDLPLGSPDGADSVFTADDKGLAAYEASFEPCLQGSTGQLMAGLAIAYHSDEMTHGDEPGPMGNKSHVQLFTALPEDAAMPK